jgi:hypothetical protein
MLKTKEFLPVLFSIGVIILIAILQRQSKFVAAVTATMPINTALGWWIVYSANNGDQGTMEQFGLGMLLGIVPSIGFIATSWLAARAGLKLLPILLVGYGAWGVGVGLIWLLRRALGV